MLQENFAAKMGLGTGLLCLPTSNGLVKECVHIRLWFPFPNTVSSLESILTELVNCQRVLQKHNCVIFQGRNSSILYGERNIVCQLSCQGWGSRLQTPSPPFLPVPILQPPLENNQVRNQSSANCSTTARAL